MANPTDPKLWQDYDKAVAPLVSGVPMLLLPVRLETRWTDDELLIRVYPDAVHVDALARGLTADERRDGLAVWDAVRKAGIKSGWKPEDGLAAGSPAVARVRERWTALVEAAGAWRAAWIVRETEDGEAELGGETEAVAALLPVRWAFALRLGDRSELRAVGATIPRGLRVLPDLEAADPFAGAAVKWLIDFAEAERVGMAIRLPLAGLRMPLRSLVVVGVYTANTDPDAVQDDVERLLESHRYSVGTDLLAPGAPTNNTEEAAVAARRPDPLELWVRERTRKPRVSPRLRRDEPRPAADPTGGLLRWFGAVDEREETGRAAMQAALWPSTWKDIAVQLRDKDSPWLSEATRTALAGHFCEHVRADGPLPTLRIGSQPYGLLPVQVPVEGDGFVGGLGRVLKRLRPLWLQAAAKVPRLDPGADEGADGQPPAFSRVINTHPWPLRYAVSPTVDAYQGEPDWADTVAALRKFTPSFPPNVGVSGLAELPKAFANWATGTTRLADAATLGEQTAALELLRGAAAVLTKFSGSNNPTATAVKDAVKHLDRMGSSLQTYLTRVAGPLQTAGIDVDATGKFPTFALGAGRYAVDPERGRRWNRPKVAASRTFMTALATALRQRTVKLELAGAEPGSLLDELLLAAAKSLLGQLAERQAMAGHVDTLAALPDATLERLMAGSLSLATTRLDAWLTSLATRRLRGLRVDAPRGLLVGAYGVLEDLRRGFDPGEGHVLAPSVAHATTAAVLRSAFNVHGGAASPYELDLTSARVRRAREVLAALESGVRLGAVLGQMAERALHDARKDDLIDELRKHTAGDPGQPTDGVALARSLADKTLPAALKPAEPVFAPIADVFDAIADVGVFDAMHGLLQRDTARVGSILEALDRGEGGARPPVSLDTPRVGTVIRQRLVALLPGGAGPGWGSRSLAARLAPALERWAAHWLGSPERIVYRAHWRRGEQVGSARRTLAGGPGALDLVRLCSAPELGASGPLAALLRATAAEPGAAVTELEAFPSDLVPGELALGEVVVLAHALRCVLGHARPLTGADVPTARSDAPADPPALASWLAEAPGELLHYALAGIEPAIAGLASSPADHPARVAALRGSIAALSVGDAGARTALGLDWLPALVRVADPLPGPATPATSEQLQAWLAGLARVRPAADALASALRLVDALRDGRRYGLSAVQTPGPAEPWCGHARPPAGAQECGSWVVVRPADAIDSGFGLVVDEWTERVPVGEGVGGLALHWNAPASRAPQALLLAVPTAAWSLAGLVELVTQTVDDARLRMVEQEHLAGVGALLPAVFLDGPLATGTSFVFSQELRPLFPSPKAMVLLEKF